MRRRFFIIPLFITCLYSCVNLFSNDLLQHDLSSREMRDDYDLFRNVLEKAHPGLYEYHSKFEMHNLFDSIRQTLSKDLSKREFFNRLAFITDKIGCAHTSVYFSENDIRAIEYKRFFFPLNLIYIENKLCVNTPNDDLPLGSVLISINNIPVDSIIQQLLFYHTTDGFVTKTKFKKVAENFGYYYYLKFGAKEKFNIVYKSDKDSRLLQNATIEAISYKKLKEKLSRQFYYDANDYDYDLKIDDSLGVAFMTLRTLDFSSNSRDRVFTNFMNNSFRLLNSSQSIKNLIIDLRENNGGNYKNCFLLYSYLTNKKFHEFDTAWVKFTNVPYAAFTSDNFRSSEWDAVENIIEKDFKKDSANRHYLVPEKNAWWQPNHNRFTGNVFLVTNPSVSSAAAYLAALLYNEGRATLVGEETEGGYYKHNGFHMLEYELPNTRIGFSFSIANVKHALPGKFKEPIGRGVIPNHWVPSTYQDFLENNDTQVQYIIDSLIK
ncbi:MAG TPA: S41 family peptidase [Chitinophagaceae bacterium]|nr:S41 family peptidase [Chitinophagaceae bacterium]